jgi:hypothetical protein
MIEEEIEREINISIKKLVISWLERGFIGNQLYQSKSWLYRG